MAPVTERQTASGQRGCLLLSLRTESQVSGSVENKKRQLKLENDGTMDKRWVPQICWVSSRWLRVGARQQDMQGRSRQSVDGHSRAVASLQLQSLCATRRVWHTRLLFHSTDDSSLLSEIGSQEKGSGPPLGGVQLISVSGPLLGPVRGIPSASPLPGCAGLK